MRSTLTALLILAIAASAQTVQESFAEQSVGPIIIHRWIEGAPNSHHRIVEGQTFSTISEKNAVVTVSLRDVGNSLCLDIAIANHGSSPTDIYPKNFTLETMGRERRPLTYQRPEKLIASIRRRAAWNAALIGLAASMAKTRTATNGSYTVAGPGGLATVTGSSSTTQPDYLARARSYDLQDATIRNAGEAMAQVQRLTLKDNTLDPGAVKYGTVFFQGPKADRYLVNVPVAGEIYQFALEPTR